jgi:beta-alanine degradation protein BauB
MKRCVLFLFLAALLTAQSSQEVEITAEPHHHQIFANDQVRVFNVEIAPHTETLMHWHRHDYIYVQLGASEVVNAVQGKDPVTVKLTDGQTGLLSASFAHVARNLSDQPFRNVTIELLQGEKLHQSSSKWDEDRGLDVLQGGTREIFWVKDGVRASEYELQPGGVIPTHHHAGPHLVVALTDFELRSDVAGKPPATVTVKSGESKWVPGGFTHTLTNTGHHPAKFVTLEFP